MKSLERLRGCTFIGAGKVNEYIDEIEREIAERYMELPVDMDGVPIRLWDKVQFVNDAGGTGAPVEICAVSNHYAYYGEGKHFYKASMCRHVKPRTVEDVLRDLVDGIGSVEFDALTEIDRAVDEIRDLLGGDGR